MAWKKILVPPAKRGGAKEPVLNWNGKTCMFNKMAFESFRPKGKGRQITVYADDKSIGNKLAFGIDPNGDMLQVSATRFCSGLARAFAKAELPAQKMTLTKNEGGEVVEWVFTALREVPN